MVRIFVTGAPHSGKTHFATSYAAERGIHYTPFDLAHDYRDTSEQSAAILDSLPDSFVIDAIPFDADRSFTRFFEYEGKHEDVEIIWVYCPRDEWLRRVAQKATFGGRNKGLLSMILAGRPRRLSRYPRFVLDLLRRAISKFRAWIKSRSIPKVRHDLVSKRRSLRLPESEEQLHRYRSWFESVLNQEFGQLRYFDSASAEYTTRQEMLSRIRYDTFELEAYLHELDGDVADKFYQDIEVLDLIGYSESFRTWERIVGLVNWKGRRVVDLGCHHGYFSFKAHDEGASVVGLDRNPAALEVARKIDEVRGGATLFVEWSDHEDVPEGDVVLLLNVLHHLEDPDGVLSRLRTNVVILEINARDKPTVERHLNVEREMSSHRDNRLILKCRATNQGQVAHSQQPGDSPPNQT